MATPEDVWEGLYGQIIAAYTAAGLSPNVGIDWPAINVLDAVAQGGTGPVVSIFDRGGIRNETRAIGLNIETFQTPGSPGATLSTVATTIAPGVPISLTGGSTPIVNDCFFVNIFTYPINTYAQYTAVLGNSLATCLADLTAAINATSGLSAGLSGNTISLTSGLTRTYAVSCGVVNVGTEWTEVERVGRDIQITLWTRTVTDRLNYGVVLEQLFAQLEFNYGFQLPDNTLGRILVTDDRMQKDMQMNDLYRRDFILNVDYPIIVSSPAWIVETTREYLNQ